MQIPIELCASKSSSSFLYLADYRDIVALENVKKNDSRLIPVKRIKIADFDNRTKLKF